MKLACLLKIVDKVKHNMHLKKSPGKDITIAF